MQSLVKIIVNGQQQVVFQKGDVFKSAVAAMSMVQGLAMMVSSSGLLQNMAQQPNQLRGVAVQMFDVLMDGLKSNRKNS